MALDQRMAEQPAIEPTWSEPAEWLAVHPDKGRPPRKRTVVGGVRLYKGLDWAILADNFASPTIYASVRGGTTRVPHGQRDLLSFHVVVGDEQLVTHLRGGEYMDSTFSPRRNEIPEMMPNTKNTILINGVGITVGSELDRTQEIHGPGIEGVRLVATGAMGMIRQGHAAAEFCGRALLLLDRRALLVLDRIVLPFAGRAESRLHTYADAKLRAKTARIRGRKQSLRVTYAADVAAVLTSACPAPSLAAEPAPTMLRWCSTDRADKTFTLATLMLPGASPATLRVGGEGAHIVVHAARGKWRKTIRLTRTLRLA